VLVAGAWGDTGWPATMEGAVRSGAAAAVAALARLGSPGPSPSLAQVAS
jgi:monoamine oxidase